ncbi:MAG: TonB C-terminal domain-containing protein [Mariprofundus sp.]
MKKFNFKYLGREQQRFSFSLAASIAAHVLLALFITMADTDKPLPKKEQSQIMDVVLLDEEKKPSKKSSKDARTISNQTATGSSRNAQDRLTRQAKAPPAGRPNKPQPSVPAKQPKTPPTPPKQQQTRMLAKRGTSPNSRETKKKAKPVKKQPPVAKLKHVPLSNLMPSAMALSQLSQDFERERRMKQKLNREADVPINTRQAKYAPYAQALVRALEDQWRPGRAKYEQYPDDARRALIKMTIEHGGALAGVEILRPSPIPEINESAVEAIHAAAPFKVLPSSWGLDRVSFYLTFEVVEDRFVFRPM